MFRRFERIIERILWESRLVILLAVVASILAALLLVVIGSYDILHVLADAAYAFGDASVYAAFHKTAITHIIGALDAYLIATVLIIFGIGLYELFISKIEHIENDTRSSKILVIHSLDQLKEKLAKVIIMVLIVTFFKHAVNFSYGDIMSILALSAGIFLVALSIYLTHKKHGGKEE
ncbi:MAG: YqhA family protein [Nitrospirota bacterium]